MCTFEGLAGLIINFLALRANFLFISDSLDSKSCTFASNIEKCIANFTVVDLLETLVGLFGGGLALGRSGQNGFLRDAPAVKDCH